jgi:hypothetical protein
MGTTRLGFGGYNYDTEVAAQNLADAFVRSWVTEPRDFMRQSVAAIKKTLFGFADRFEQYEDAFAQLQLADSLAGETLLCRPLAVRSTASSQGAQTAPSYGTRWGAHL